MIADADSTPQNARLAADVCIIGAGAAGIPLALTLAERGLQVVLLESGRALAHAPTQDLYAGEVADEKLHSPPDKYRQRRMGGSTTLWGGRCMPFEPLDFEARPQVPHSDWPIGYGDIAPFYPAANEWAEAGFCTYDARDALPGVGPLLRGFESQMVRTDGLERFSCPTDFGRRYARRMALAPTLRVLQGANVTGLRLEADGRALREVEVTTLAGRRFSVAARSTVLAAGGLETARLLLASRDVAPEGVGNGHDVVGRYYQCHIAGNAGSLVLSGTPADVRHGYEVSPEGIYCRRRLSLTAETQRSRGLANAVARLHFPRITDPRHRNGVLSGLFLARRFISYEYGKRLNDGTATTPATIAQHLFNVVADPFDTAAFLHHWITRRTLAQRKFPSVILRNRSNRFSLELHGEQAPRADSRVTLAEGRDALGMPRLRVDWRYSASDIDSLAGLLDVLAAEFARTGTGQLTYQRETLEEDLTRFGAYGGHHIGTARMGSDPRTSVVNADCRLHGVHNLYVAGSAAFATSSQANPTLTLIALSLRLGDHLARRLAPGVAQVAAPAATAPPAPPAPPVQAAPTVQMPEVAA